MATSKWWPISLLIVTVVFIAVGGGLIGGSIYDGYYFDYVNPYDMFYAGVALVVLGGLLKISFWVVLIIYCVQRRRHSKCAQPNYVLPPPGTHVSYHGVETRRVELDSPVPPQPVYNAPPAGYVPSPSVTPTPFVLRGCDARWDLSTI